MNTAVRTATTVLKNWFLDQKNRTVHPAAVRKFPVSCHPAALSARAVVEKLPPHPRQVLPVADVQPQAVQVVVTDEQGNPHRDAWKQAGSLAGQLGSVGIA